MPFGRVLLAWVAMAVAMSANGVLREHVLRHSLTTQAADAVSAGLGALIILLIAFFSFRPLAGSDVRRLLLVSAVLVILTVLFEFAIGRLLDRKTWSELLGNYAIWRGRLWPLLLLLIALTPFIRGRWFARQSNRF